METVQVILGTILSWLPYIILLAVVLTFSSSVRKRIKLAEETNALLKENSTLLKEISAKLNK